MSKLLDGTGGNRDMRIEKSVNVLETFTSFQYMICDTGYIGRHSKGAATIEGIRKQGIKYKADNFWSYFDFFLISNI